MILGLLAFLGENLLAFVVDLKPTEYAVAVILPTHPVATIPIPLKLLRLFSGPGSAVGFVLALLVGAEHAHAAAITFSSGHGATVGMLDDIPHFARGLHLAVIVEVAEFLVVVVAQ